MNKENIENTTKGSNLTEVIPKSTHYSVSNKPINRVMKSAIKERPYATNYPRNSQSKSVQRKRRSYGNQRERILLTRRVNRPKRIFDQRKSSDNGNTIEKDLSVVDKRESNDSPLDFQPSFRNRKQHNYLKNTYNREVAYQKVMNSTESPVSKHNAKSVMGSSSRVPSSKARKQRRNISNRQARINHSNKSKLNALSVKYNKPIRMKNQLKKTNPESNSKTSKIEKGKIYSYCCFE